MFKRHPRARKTVIDGFTFDSLSEAKRYSTLKLMQEAGHIRNLRVHVAFPIEINGQPMVIRSNRYPNGYPCRYTADFVYEEYILGEWIEVIEEHKGHDERVDHWRRAAFECASRRKVRVTGPAAKKLGIAADPYRLPHEALKRIRRPAKEKARAA